MLSLIVDSFSDLEEFYNFLLKEDCIFDVVRSDSSLHPLDGDLSCIFCKCIFSGKYFILPVDHSESIFSVNKEDIAKKINESKNNIFVFNKKSFDQSMGTTVTKDINILRYLKEGKQIESEEFNTSAHRFIQNAFYQFKNLNKSIPILKHNEKFRKMCQVAEDIIKESESGTFLKLNGDLTNVLSEMEKNGLYVNPDKFLGSFGQQHKKHINPQNLVHCQYNIYTSTGRPSNRFGGINYAALKKDNGERSCFESRFGDNGMLVLMDYKSYHPRILADLIGYNFPFDVDVYEFLSKYYFKTDIVNNEDIKKSKDITFQLLYGGITKEYEDIPYFKKVQKYTDILWSEFQTSHYVETPLFKKRIKPCHISDPFPSKLLNYIIQSQETELNCEMLRNVLDLTKDTRSKVILYQYDSILIDFYKDDGRGRQLLLDVKKIMEKDKFPVSIQIGSNFHEMKKVDSF